MEPLFPDFKVDNFYANRKGKYMFFLSHNHEDHLDGLTVKVSATATFKKPKLDWANGSIFTSEHSAKILLDRFPHLQPYTVPLKLMTEYNIRGRRVWLIPANHCPGATMILVRGEDNH